MDTWLNVTRPADAFLRMSQDSNLPAGLGIARALRLPAGVTLELVKKSFQRVVQENESLRVRVENRAGIWQQLVFDWQADRKELFPEIPHEDPEQIYPNIPTDVAAWITACQRLYFSIETGKVFVTASYTSPTGETWCYISVHPAVADSQTIDMLWGRIAALIGYELDARQEVFVKRLSLSDLLEAQRKTAGVRFTHTEYWLANPKADLRDDDSVELILSQPDTSIAGRRDTEPGIPITASYELAPEIKDLLLQAATSYGGTWEQAQLASMGSYFARKAGAQRANIGYPFSNLLLFEESAPWSDAASQILCRSQNVLPMSIPGAGMGLEQMKQAKVQLDRIEDHSLVSQTEINDTASKNEARAFGAIVEVKEVNSELMVGEHSVSLHTLSNGPVEDMHIIVCGLSDAQEPTTYFILANSNLYSTEQVNQIFPELLNWQYQWALAVLNKQPVDSL